MANYDSINITKEVQVKVITPLHIGGAAEKIFKRGFDFFWKEGSLYFVEFRKLFQALQQKNVRQSEYLNLIESGNFRDIENYLFKTLRIDIENLCSRKIKLNSDPGADIRQFARGANGSPYLPGSSIKGALRSVLFSHLKGSHVPNGPWDIDPPVFGGLGNDLMRFVRVGDAFFENEQTTIGYVDLFNLYKEGRNWESGWKGNFNLPTEYVTPTSSSSFRLSLAEPLKKVIELEYRKADKLHTNLNRVLNGDSFENLKKIINTHTKNHLNRELEFLKEYDQATDAGTLIDNVEALLKQVESKNSCLLRIGFGSGFHSITGDWQFKDHRSTIQNPNRGKYYKSRKVLGDSDHLNFMGFVKLTF